LIGLQTQRISDGKKSLWLRFGVPHFFCVERDDEMTTDPDAMYIGIAIRKGR